MTLVVRKEYGEILNKTAKEFMIIKDKNLAMFYLVVSGATAP